MMSPFERDGGDGRDGGFPTRRLSSHPSHHHSLKPRHLAREADDHPTRNIREWAIGARPKYLRPVPSTAVIVAVTAEVTPIIVRRVSPCFFREVIITGAQS
jgi:hypothetical protein